MPCTRSNLVIPKTTKSRARELQAIREQLTEGGQTVGAVYDGARAPRIAGFPQDLLTGCLGLPCIGHDPFLGDSVLESDTLSCIEVSSQPTTLITPVKKNLSAFCPMEVIMLQVGRVSLWNGQSDSQWRL